MEKLYLVWKHQGMLQCADNSAYGVYVIWKVSLLGAAVEYVGSGWIGKRLLEHGTKWAYIGSHEPNHYLSRYEASYANVDSDYTEGVEKFLAERMTPWRGERHPDVAEIAVNLPDKPPWYHEFTPS